MLGGMALPLACFFVATVAAAGGRVEWTWSEGTLLVDLGGAVVREGGEEVAVVWR